MGYGDGEGEGVVWGCDGAVMVWGCDGDGDGFERVVASEKGKTRL